MAILKTLTWGLSVFPPLNYSKGLETENHLRFLLNEITLREGKRLIFAPRHNDTTLGELPSVEQRS